MHWKNGSLRNWWSLLNVKFYQKINAQLHNVKTNNIFQKHILYINCLSSFLKENHQKIIKKLGKDVARQYEVHCSAIELLCGVIGWGVVRCSKKSKHWKGKSLLWLSWQLAHSIFLMKATSVYIDCSRK